MSPRICSDLRLADVYLFLTYFDENPQQLTERNYFGSSPLHYVIRHMIPHMRRLPAGYLVHVMLGMNSSLAASQDQDGALPLHVACAQKSEIQLMAVGHLLAVFPGGARMRTNDGDLPLRLAVGIVNTGQTLPVVEKLLAAYPQGTTEHDYHGDTALLMAVERQTGEEGLAIVKLLCEAHPEATRARNNYYTLPLHIAARRNIGEVGVAMVKALLAEFPDGVSQRDDHGYRPLHYAAQYQEGEHGLAVVDALVAIDKKGPRIRTLACCKLPWELAAENTVPDDDIVSLLKKCAKVRSESI